MYCSQSTTDPGLLRLPGHCWGIAAIVLVGGRHAGGLQVIGGAKGGKVSTYIGGSPRRGRRQLAAAGTDKILGGALLWCPLISLAACGRRNVPFQCVVVFSLQLFYFHTAAWLLIAKASGCPYSVDFGSLYKAEGGDPYSSPIHGNSPRQEWEDLL